MKSLLISVVVFSLFISCAINSANAEFGGIYEPQMDLFKGVLATPELSGKYQLYKIDPSGKVYAELQTKSHGLVYIRYDSQSKTNLEIGVVPALSPLGVGDGSSYLYYDTDADGRLDSFRVNAIGQIKANAKWQGEYGSLLNDIFAKLECQGLW